jgi:hypothetical protein
LPGEGPTASATDGVVAIRAQDRRAQISAATSSVYQHQLS